MSLVGFPPGGGAGGGGGLKFDYYAAGLAKGTTRAANTTTWGIQFAWNGLGVAPVLTGAKLVINANAADVDYVVRLLKYTGTGTTSTTEQTVNVTTLAIGEVGYTVAFTPTALDPYQVYGVAVHGSGENYYTDAVFTYLFSGPGHVATVANSTPVVASGQQGAVVFTLDHKRNNAAPPVTPSTSLPLPGFCPISPLFSNAS